MTEKSKKHMSSFMEFVRLGKKNAEKAFDEAFPLPPPDLIKACANNNKQEDWNSLLKLVARRVSAVLATNSMSTEDKKDVCQKILKTVSTNLHTVDPKKFKAWLNKVISTRSADVVKMAGYRERFEPSLDDSDNESLAEMLVATTIDSAAAAIQTEERPALEALKPIVEKCVKQLEAENRHGAKILKLHVVKGLSVEKIAEHLKDTADQVQKIIEAALTRLRMLFEEAVKSVELTLEKELRVIIREVVTFHFRGFNV